MRRYEELEFEEREEVKALFRIWLNEYSSEVVREVMKRAEEILNNDFAMNLLRELAKRECEERRDFERSIDLFRDYNGFAEYDVHCYPISHSKSYRDVLYDMYIR